MRQMHEVHSCRNGMERCAHVVRYVVSDMRCGMSCISVCTVEHAMDSMVWWSGGHLSPGDVRVCFGPARAPLHVQQRETCDSGPAHRWMSSALHFVLADSCGARWGAFCDDLVTTWHGIQLACHCTHDAAHPAMPTSSNAAARPVVFGGCARSSAATDVTRSLRA